MRLSSFIVIASLASCAHSPSIRAERVEPLTWAPCPAKSDATDDSSARCARAVVPLRHGDPSGRTLTLFVKWIPAKTPSHRALWLVPGGPGSSGVVIERLATRLHDADPGLDVYLPDHRGTGRSMRLGCSTEESNASPGGAEITMEEWPACFGSLKATWGDGLAAFNTTEAANDLCSLIDRTRAPNASVFVFGVSYGTYLVQRYLQLNPTQPTGVVLDSIAPPVAAFSQFDRWSNDGARKLLEACDQDAFCAQKLADLYPSWPRYVRDASVGQWAQSNVPMLMLAGS